MSKNKISWEIILVGLLMTGMAIILASNSPSLSATATDSYSAEPQYLLPEGPSCEVKFANPHNFNLPQIIKDHHIQLDTEQLKSLHKLNRIEIKDGSKGSKQVILITPKSKEVYTISG
jgi:hypothetical protein